MNKKETWFKKLPLEEQTALLKDFFTSGGTPPNPEISKRADLLAVLLGYADVSESELRTWQKETFPEKQVATQEQDNEGGKSPEI